MLNRQIVSSIPVLSLSVAGATAEQPHDSGVLLIDSTLLDEVNGLQSELIAVGHEYAEQSDLLATAQERIALLETAICQFIALPIDARMVGLYEVVGKPSPARYLGQSSQENESRE